MLDNLRKDSLANLCIAIQNQKHEHDSFDTLLQQHAMEFGDDGDSTTTAPAPNAFVVPKSSSKAAAPFLAAGLSPITFSSASSSTSSLCDVELGDADAEGDIDEDIDLGVESDESESDEDMYDLDVYVPKLEPSLAALLYADVDADAPFIPKQSPPPTTFLLADRSPSPNPAASAPSPSSAPFASPAVPHKAFSPGTMALAAPEKSPHSPSPRKRASPSSSSRLNAKSKSKSKSKARLVSSFSDDEDGDDYQFSGNDDDDDEEYAPPRQSRKRGRGAAATPRRRVSGPRKKSSSTSTRSSTSTPQPSRRKRRRIVPESRNLQISSSALVQTISTLSSTSASSCDFICPVCKWEQVNKRLPDFQRHLKTHARADKEDKTMGWWCKGVRVECKDDFNRRMLEEGGKKIPEGAEEYLFHDHMRVGGCCQTFSRRDALKRHTSNMNVPCTGVLAWGLKEE